MTRSGSIKDLKAAICKSSSKLMQKFFNYGSPSGQEVLSSTSPSYSKSQNARDLDNIKRSTSLQVIHKPYDSQRKPSSTKPVDSNGNTFISLSRKTTSPQYQKAFKH
uniref:Uncharacterized protein n=1 Tax=Romanomermis culicivorax TaxID=13658 RepID=A0A915JRN9_ROMCU